jgi:hypothetical protein
MIDGDALRITMIVAGLHSAQVEDFQVYVGEIPNHPCLCETTYK